MNAGFKFSVLSATLLFSSLAFYSIPQRCEASVIEQLCSSVTDFLNDEAAKTDADLKACKDKCGWKKRKDDLVDAARKKAKESCSRGEAPDVNELSKGLDRNTKDRLKGLYDRNSRMFDGKAKLEAANFGAVSSKDTAITGKGGGVTDLKSSEPDIPELNSGTEFSLNGTKLAGDTSNPTAAGRSATLTKTSADAVLASYTESPSGTDASAPVTVSTQTGEAAANQKRYDDCITGWNNSIKANEDKIAFKRIQLAELQAHLKTCRTPTECNLINSQISDANDSIKVAQEQIAKDEAARKNLSPDVYLWNCINYYNCPGGLPRSPDDTCPCSPGEIRTIADKCEPEAGPRSLTKEEMERAKTIFGNKITDYKKIKIVTEKKNMDLWGKILTSGLPAGSAVTSGHTIYFPGYTSGNPGDSGVLLHEMTHIYQRETHSWLGFQWGKSTGGNGTYTPLLIADKPFNDYKFEEQAAIIQAYSSGWIVRPSGENTPKPMTPDEKALIETMLKNAGLLK